MKSSVRLGDLIEFSTRKTSSDSQPSQDYISTDSMFPNLGGVGFGISNLPKGKVRRFREGEVLFSNIRTHFRKVWFANRSGGCSNDVLVLRPKGERLLPRYLYCIVSSKSFIAHTVATSKGAKMPRGDTSAMLQYECYLPSIAEQSTIASILGALDDKIDLNRRMNETLEAMARAIFKSWFVDFDPVRAKAEGKQPFGMDADTAALFPDRLVDSEIGPIPEGWEVRSLDQVADYINGAACQKYKAEPGEGSLPVLKIREINQGVTAQTDRASVDIPDKHRATDGDVLFSWSGTLICKIWTGGEGFVNQHVFKVSSTDYPRWFFLYWTKHHLDEFRRIAADKATTMGHIKRSHLSSAKTVVPNNDLLQAGTRAIGQLDDLRVSNNLESRTLAELRDLLLPKLLSGEIRVKDAEKAMQAAI
jgi:type I restriction enzyme, S subunit